MPGLGAVALPGEELSPLAATFPITKPTAALQSQLKARSRFNQNRCPAFGPQPRNGTWPSPLP